ncbi:MAG: hypothetical protein ACM31O_05670 [Bacteroidota bacterium]|jgi:hypothetical protein
MPDRAYIVVPFERIGTSIGPRQAIVVDHAEQARLVAQELASRVSGVAVLQRQIDPDTGDGIDVLVAGFGAIPPRFPDCADWTLRLQ